LFHGDKINTNDDGDVKNMRRENCCGPGECKYATNASQHKNMPVSMPGDGEEEASPTNETFHHLKFQRGDH
jgi:hypothetical protein